jgi:glucose-1-phosphate thymidylyltransferase
VKALILAAGYATRLRPLTDTWAKELLPVGGRPIIDWITDAIAGVEAIDELYVVTNSHKAPAFHAWAAARGGGVTVCDDGTTSNDDRLGAVGDLHFVIESAGIDDDMLVIAGDNLFDFSLSEYVAFWNRKRDESGAASAVAVRDIGSIDIARRMGIVELAADARVTAFVEKPDDPPSTLAATATYLFDRSHVALVGSYLDAGNPHDQPGRYVAWLQAREPVYGWVFSEPWYDIGDAAQLLVADNHLRARRGLPERDTYSPDA